MLRWVLGGVVCLVVGGVLLDRYLSGLPALDQLTRVEGVVAAVDRQTLSSRRSKSQVLVVRVGDAPPMFYPEHLPEFDRVAGALRRGDRVTAWADVGRESYVWQLDRGDERLVAYDQVADAQRATHIGGGVFGGLFVAVGVGLLAVGLRRRTGRRPTAQGA